MCLFLFFCESTLKCVFLSHSVRPSLCQQSRTGHCHPWKRCVTGMQTQSVAKTADHMEEERQADTAKQEVQQISSAASEDRRRSLFADILCRMCHRRQTVVFRKKKKKSLRWFREEFVYLHANCKGPEADWKRAFVGLWVDGLRLLSQTLALLEAERAHFAPDSMESFFFKVMKHLCAVYPDGEFHIWRWPDKNRHFQKDRHRVEEQMECIRD